MEPIELLNLKDKNYSKLNLSIKPDIYYNTYRTNFEMFADLISQKPNYQY